jgi:putative CocE/NonD family hydrolase
VDPRSAANAGVAAALRGAPISQEYLDGRSDVLRYTSAPLSGKVALSGWGSLEFYASSDCDDTEWHARVVDVHPDGRAVEVAAACLRASYRASLSSPTPLQPGATYRFQLELSPLTHAFLPGHRVRLTVTSSHFPVYARGLNRFGPYADMAEPRVAVNAIHHGGLTPSRVALPVTDGSFDQALA